MGQPTHNFGKQPLRHGQGLDRVLRNPASAIERKAEKRWLV